MKCSTVENNLLGENLASGMKTCMEPIKNEGHKVIGSIVINNLINMVNGRTDRENNPHDLFNREVRSIDIIIGPAVRVPRAPDENISVPFDLSPLEIGRQTSLASPGYFEFGFDRSFYTDMGRSNPLSNLWGMMFPIERVFDSEMGLSLIRQIFGGTTGLTHFYQCLKRMMASFFHFTVPILILCDIEV
jgi:hypothetical protein